MQDYGPLVEFDNPALIHESAQLYGKIKVGEGASIWPNVVARAESHEIVIERHVNIQDFTMIHVGGNGGTYVGAYTTVGHRATIHGCRIGENCLIGINAVILDDVEIGDNCIIGAHCLLPAGKRIPANSLVMGAPGKVVREQNNFVTTRMSAWLYHRNARAYTEGHHRSWSDADYEQEKAAEAARIQQLFHQRYGD